MDGALLRFAVEDQMQKQPNISGRHRSTPGKFAVIFFLVLCLFFSALYSNFILAENLSMTAQVKKYKIGCRPTQPDALGPFYKPNAPLRNSVGTGYKLSGMVISSNDCTPIPAARIELWMAGPDGDYKDIYRATVVSNEAGEYYFESHLPPSYLRRPPHIHMRVSADGHRTLVTQHYPKDRAKRGAFDLVLIPNK